DPQKFVKDREDLNRERIAAVQKFLNAETAGTGLVYTVLVHNPADPGIAGVPANNAVSQWYLGAPAGVVPVGVGAAGSGGAGGAARRPRVRDGGDRRTRAHAAVRGVHRPLPRLLRGQPGQPTADAPVRAGDDAAGPLDHLVAKVVSRRPPTSH